MFGMGTGGSLRLLSPEILGSLGFLPRTLKTAQVALAFASALLRFHRPDHGQLPLRFHILSQIIFRFQFPVPGLKSALAFPVPCFPFTVPSSSKIKPSTD